MSLPFEQLAELDRLIHQPARLAILTALERCVRADFLFIQRLTGLTKGNLSSHLLKLEEGGLVEIEKEFTGKTPRTVARLTSKGRKAITQYWEQLNDLRESVRDWEAGSEKPDPDHG